MWREESRRGLDETALYAKLPVVRLPHRVHLELLKDSPLGIGIPNLSVATT
jgi:hypothetical protein